MRATQGNHRLRTWTRVTALAALVMLGASIVPAGALAATPSWGMVVTPLPSQVKPGDVAGYRVVISNIGTSNISQVFLTTALQTSDDPPVFADPAQILPIAYIATSQGTCDAVDTTPPLVDVFLDCALGAIRSGRSATVIVGYQTHVDWAQLKVIVEANTTGVAGDNPGSSHGDVLQEVGLTDINPSNDFGGRFVTTGNQGVANGLALGVANPQSTKVNAPKVGIPVTVADGDEADPIDCPVTITCWSETSEIHVGEGALYPSGFSVEIGIYKTLAETVHGVYHEFDEPRIVGGVEVAGETITTKCPKNGAPSAAQIPCFSVTKLGGGSILVTVWLKENGKISHF